MSGSPLGGDRSSGNPDQCVVLVPTYGGIDRECEAGLTELERRGYVVRRVGGFSQIDLGRSQMATDAIRDGFEETMWIDSDIGFDPDDVDRLRRHGVPIVAGVYPVKNQRRLAVHVGERTEPFRFGTSGGLETVQYVATGFLLVQSVVYDAVKSDSRLVDCFHGGDSALTPYFLPMIRQMNDGRGWYLGEDYAFCERARRAGFDVRVDTTIRLRHFGRYGFSWEDAGEDRPRYADYTYHFR